MAGVRSMATCSSLFTTRTASPHRRYLLGCWCTDAIQAGADLISVQTSVHATDRNDQGRGPIRLLADAAVDTRRRWAVTRACRWRPRGGHLRSVHPQRSVPRAVVHGRSIVNLLKSRQSHAVRHSGTGDLPSDWGGWLMRSTGLPWLPRVGIRTPCSV